MRRRPPRFTRTDTLCPYTTRCRSLVKEVRILNDNVFDIVEGEQIGESKLILVANGKLIRRATSTLARQLKVKNPFPNELERGTMYVLEVNAACKSICVAKIQ